MKILSKLFPEIKTTPQVQVQKKEVETKYSVEEQKIKELFEKNGEPLTAEKMEEVQKFLNETEGTLDEKMASLQKVIEKDVEITADNLKAVHQAVHKDIKIETVLPELKIDNVYSQLPKDIKAELKALINEGMPLEVAMKVMLKTNLEKILFPEKVGELEEKPEIKESKIQDVDKETRPVKERQEPKATAKSEPSKDHARVELENDGDLQMIEDAFEQLGESLDDLSHELMPLVSPDIVTTKLPVRKLVEVSMTEKMAETKKTFDMYQKAIVGQLKQVTEATDKVSVKEVLSQVIDKLDHIIMKSDVPLYTDMKTERDLLTSSSELELAKDLVDKDTDKAFKIIEKVRKQVDKIIYKPVKQKVFMATQKEFVDRLYNENLLKAVPMDFEGIKSSPRSVLETLRHLGINHEVEVQDHLLKKGKEMRAPANIKMILMKLEESADQRVQAKETLENLTGQQLLNKLEIKSHKQQMTFNVPIKIDSEIKQLKVHVNAKKDNQKIDWKNSRLYFVIHLKKLGDTGVLVDVNKGHVNITVKNDQTGIESQMKTYVDQAMERLESVGFKSSTIKFEKLTEDKKISVEQENFEVSL